MDGCTCRRCSEYTAPEVLCRGALLLRYIQAEKKVWQLEDTLSKLKSSEGKGK